MIKAVKKIVIIGIGDVGFTVLKQLNNLADDIEIIAINRRFPPYLKEYISSTNENNKITFVKADVIDETSVQKIIKKEKLNDISVLISTVGKAL